jgi:hypothetical protein
MAGGRASLAMFAGPAHIAGSSFPDAGCTRRMRHEAGLRPGLSFGEKPLRWKSLVFAILASGTISGPSEAEVLISDVIANENPMEIAYYIRGILDGAAWINAQAARPRPYCLPETLRLSAGAFREMAGEFAKRNGTPLDAGFASIATAALTDAFPCK